MQTRRTLTFLTAAALLSGMAASQFRGAPTRSAPSRSAPTRSAVRSAPTRSVQMRSSPRSVRSAPSRPQVRSSPGRSRAPAIRRTPTRSSVRSITPRRTTSPGRTRSYTPARRTTSSRRGYTPRGSSSARHGILGGSSSSARTRTSPSSQRSSRRITTNYRPSVRADRNRATRRPAAPRTPSSSRTASRTGVRRIDSSPRTGRSPLVDRFDSRGTRSRRTPTRTRSPGVRTRSTPTRSASPLVERYGDGRNRGVRRNGSGVRADRGSAGRTPTRVARPEPSPDSRSPTRRDAPRRRGGPSGGGSALPSKTGFVRYVPGQAYRLYSNTSPHHHHFRPHHFHCHWYWPRFGFLRCWFPSWCWTWWQGYWSSCWLRTYGSPFLGYGYAYSPFYCTTNNLLPYSTVVFTDYVTADEPRGEEVAGEEADRSSPAALAKYYVELGDLYFRTRRYLRAAEAYTRAIRLVGDDGSLRLVQADAWFAIGEFDKAAYAIRQGLLLDPALAEVDVDKRDFYGWPEDFERHMKALRDHLERRPLDTQARLVLAYNLRFTKQKAEARKELEKLRDHVPGDRAVELLLAALTEGKDEEKLKRLE